MRVSDTVLANLQEKINQQADSINVLCASLDASSSRLNNCIGCKKARRCVDCEFSSLLVTPDQVCLFRVEESVTNVPVPIKKGRLNKRS